MSHAARDFLFFSSLLARTKASVTAVALALLITPVRAQTTAPDSAPHLRLERALGLGRSTLVGAALSGDKKPYFAAAQTLEGELEERLRLSGDAELRTDGAVLRGDRIDYHFVSDRLKVEGKARLYQDGVTFAGPQLNVQLQTMTGTMPDADFSYAARGGRGHAQRIDFLGQTRAQMNDTTFTTCGPGDNAWWVKAETLSLDRVEELGVARASVLYFQGLPIFASPYFQFPLGDHRRSGLLVPGFWYNSKLGPEVALPFYWNMAPNHDWTFTPRVMSRRGVLFGNEFRYLEPNYHGTIEYDVTPVDRSYGGARQFLNLQHQQTLAPGLTAAVNFNRVSDDNFFVDFSHSIVASSSAVLPQEAALNYGTTYWASSVRVAKNQPLLSLLPNGLRDKPYEREPQWNLNALRYDWNGFDVGTAVEVTRFSHPVVENGSRAIINPSISYPWLTPGYFVVPKVQWHFTNYQLDSKFHNGASAATRSLPLLSLDSGLVFERDASWLGRSAVQTLEPRAFYAYVPFRDQSGLPNFDSGVSDFNFAQLLTENVYSGSDRIGAANQLTTAVTSRLFDAETGAERWRAAVGQRFYFSDQQVVLPGARPRTGKASDLLFGVGGTAASHLLADLAMQYSTENRQTMLSTAALRWQPRAASVVSMSYRFQRDLLEQLDFAAQWPLAKRWYGVARLNYSLPEDRWIETLLGVEYKADCWVLRLAAHRYATARDNATTTLFVQVELNGLASVGTSPVEQLRRTIPGYQLINPPPQPGGRYETYE